MWMWSSEQRINSAKRAPLSLCTCYHQCGKDQTKKYIQLVMMAVCVKLLFGFLITSLEPRWKGF